MTIAIGNGATQTDELVQEMYGGELYEYYPLGKYIVRAPGVCGGRPTFKYTRLEPSVILSMLAQGETVEEILADYQRSKISAEALYEAISLANQAFISRHHAFIHRPNEFEDQQELEPV